MISFLYESFQKYRDSREGASDRKQYRDQLKLQELIQELNRKDENDKEISPSLQQESTSGLQSIQYQNNCTKLEGVITSLNNVGGVINEKYKFTKIASMKYWSHLMVGSKLTFLLFEGCVRYIEMKESDWDDGSPQAVQIPCDDNPVLYNTDCRTVIGNIMHIKDEILYVETGNNQEMHILLANHPDLKWCFVEGDVLKLECIIQEDESTWNPANGTFGNILEVISFKPSREKREIGRVSAVFNDYAIIDESALASFSLLNTKLKLFQKYEYEAIETESSYNARTFYWRVIKIIEQVGTNDVDRNNDGSAGVQLHDASISLRQEFQRETTQTISIYNNSNEAVILKTCEISSNSGLVRLDRTEFNQVLHPTTGRFKIFLKIMPKEAGMFMEELVANFGSFKKKCLVTVEIHSHNLMMKNRELKKVNDSDRRELIPGQKVRAAPRFIEIRIKDYMIPDAFRLIDFKKHTSLVINDDLQENYPFLFEELDRDNYASKMRYCLYLEEIAMEIHFARYKIERGHFENKQEYLRLEVQGIAEKRPSISIGDSIHATDLSTLNNKKPVYEGCIHKVEQNAIFAKFNPEFHQSHNRKDHRIDFFFSRSTFKRQQHALNKAVSQLGLGYDFLFPKFKTPTHDKRSQVEVTLTENENMRINGKEYPFFNANLNKYQKEAIVNILQGTCRPLPYIIYGPPGTGKTQTVVECIEQISEKMPWSRIIVAAPSNSAANLIVERLIASGRYKGGDFIRFVSFNQIEKDLIPAHLKKYCATIDISLDEGKPGNKYNLKSMESGLRLNCSKTVIVQYKIYISTLSSLGPLMQIRFNQDHFTHIIIDEAGQSVETETLIPLSFVSKQKGQVILAGDPKQLGPVLISQIGKFCGFDKSLLERLAEHEYYLPNFGPTKDLFDGRFVTKLKKNYRSLPSILGVYNVLSYGGELEAEINEEDSEEIELLKSIEQILWNRSTANRKCGVYFMNVSKGINERTNDSCSWFNNKEASQIYFFVCKLAKLGVPTKDIGIITPYALQVKNLKRIVNESMPDCDLKIGSVEEFQGQERKIILVSTVRTNSQELSSDFQFGLGFLKCEKRMNVAISRARALLVVFGKESILSQDNNWRYLVQFTKENGTYTSI